MKFKIQAGGTIDVATRSEVREEIEAVKTSWFAEVAKGDRYRRISAFGDSDAFGNVVIGDRSNDGQLGPAQGFVWSVNRLAVGSGYNPDADAQVVTVRPGNPAPGVGLVTFDVPAGEVWEVLAARYALVTSAVAGTRFPEVAFRSPDGTDLVTVSSTSSAVAASNRTYNWWQGGSGATGAGIVSMGLPQGVTIEGGASVRFSVFGIDVGDQISSVALTVRKWAPAHELSLSIGDGSAGPSGILIPQLGRYVDLTGNPVVLYPGETIAVAGTAPASRRIWLTGQVRELPLSLAWRL